MVLALFTACSMDPKQDIEIAGVWTAGTSTMTITNDSYAIDDSSAWDWDYSGEIVIYNNSTYNIAEDNPASGDFGFFVLHISEHKGDSSQIGTYTVVRWRALATDGAVTTVETSEAYPASWATPQEAYINAQADHFAYFSSMTK